MESNERGEGKPAGKSLAVQHSRATRPNSQHHPKIYKQCIYPVHVRGGMESLDHRVRLFLPCENGQTYRRDVSENESEPSSAHWHAHRLLHPDRECARPPKAYR